MKHDFRQHPTGEAADRFVAWLEQETEESMRRAYGDGEGTKAAIFLFANRACEAQMGEEQVGTIFGRSIVRAGFREEDEASAFDWLENFFQVASAVHFKP